MKNSLIRNLRAAGIRASIEAGPGGNTIIKVFKAGKLRKYWFRRAKNSFSAPIPGVLKNCDFDYIFALADDKEEKDMNKITFAFGTKKELETRVKNDRACIDPVDIRYSFSDLVAYIA